MNLGELKKSLNRFPPDMDDLEILVQYVDDSGREDSDLLLYVAYLKLRDDLFAMALGTWKAADLRQAEHPENFPPEYQRHPSKKKSRNDKKDK